MSTPLAFGIALLVTVALIYGSIRVRGLANLALLIGIFLMIIAVQNLFSISIWHNFVDFSMNYKSALKSALPFLVMGCTLTYFSGFAKDYHLDKDNPDAASRLVANLVILSVLNVLPLLLW